MADIVFSDKFAINQNMLIQTIESKLGAFGAFGGLGPLPALSDIQTYTRHHCYLLLS